MNRMRTTAILAAFFPLSLLFVAPAEGTVRATPRGIDPNRDPRGESVSSAGDLVSTKQAAPGDTVWIRVHDDGSCDPTGDPADGGQGTGLAPGGATWCWEGGLVAPGVHDSCSSTSYYGYGLPGCFRHYDVTAAIPNFWHLDTLMAFNPMIEESTAWCGQRADSPNWANPSGYGPDYDCNLILNLGRAGETFNAADGFTVGGVHMYDCEVGYDWCYLDYSLSNDPPTAAWLPLAVFTGTSNPEPGCPDSSDYGCAQYDPFSAIGPSLDNSTEDLLVRWRFLSDKCWDDQDGAGGAHTDGAWRVDHVSVKGRLSPSSFYPFNDPGSRDTYEDFEEGMPPEWAIPHYPHAQIGGYWNGGRWVDGVPTTCDWWHMEVDPGYANQGGTCTYSNNWMWAADDEAFTQNNEDLYHYRLVSPAFACGEDNPYYDPDGMGPGPDNQWTGVVVESDEYICIKDEVGDVTDTKTRVFDSAKGCWSLWRGDNYVSVGGCMFWNVDRARNWSEFLGPGIDSIQFAWDFFDRCDYRASMELPCMGRHTGATYLVDNVSVGVFDSHGTRWKQGASQRFADTFDRSLSMHSLYRENPDLTPTVPWETEDSLTIFVSDPDKLYSGPPPLNSDVHLHWRISTDCGATWDKEPSRPRGSTAFPTVPWNEKTMNYSRALSGPHVEMDAEVLVGLGPEEGTDETDGVERWNRVHENAGVYASIITRGDNTCYLNGAELWPEGTEIEYFMTARDSLDDRDTFPNRNAINRNAEELVETAAGREHDRREGWPFIVRVLPCPTSVRPLPSGQNHAVLLVDSYGRRDYDISADRDDEKRGVRCFPLVSQIYRETLDRLGVQYDFYRAGYGARRESGRGLDSQPWACQRYGGVLNHRYGMTRRYHTVIWFFGEYNSETVHPSSQLEIRDYIDRNGLTFPDSANLWLIGDDLCEDEMLTDPAWTDPYGEYETDGAYLWTTLAGLNGVSGGCDDDDGISPPYGMGLVGQVGTVLAGITAAQGYWDCPIRHNPDKGATVQTATSILKYATDQGPSKFCTSLQRHPTGSKVVVSLVGLELLCSERERDCIAQCILGPDCFGAGIPDPISDCSIEVGTGSGHDAPERLAIRANRPNPFNPTTTIGFDLPWEDNVTVRIFDAAGRRVRELMSGKVEAGADRRVVWDGRNDQGEPAASGVYFCRIEARGETAIRKMVLLR
ncbi:MAG: T9SS type A sorting domain-containing protein [Candidatus Eisenbacteria bacterium]|nr:T9SS type A sorting domain-containing protein [Candidatus Eisenbacteria bacterium]